MAELVASASQIVERIRGLLPDAVEWPKCKCGVRVKTSRVPARRPRQLSLICSPGIGDDARRRAPQSRLTRRIKPQPTTTPGRRPDDLGVCRGGSDQPNAPSGQSQRCPGSPVPPGWTRPRCGRRPRAQPPNSRVNSSALRPDSPRSYPSKKQPRCGLRREYGPPD